MENLDDGNNYALRFLKLRLETQKGRLSRIEQKNAEEIAQLEAELATRKVEVPELIQSIESLEKAISVLEAASGA